VRRQPLLREATNHHRKALGPRDNAHGQSNTVTMREFFYLPKPCILPASELIAVFGEQFPSLQELRGFIQITDVGEDGFEFSELGEIADA
jgi:hypothetical protein